MTKLPLATALVTLLIGPALATATERLDFFDQHGDRTGYATVDEHSGRLNLFDRDSRRTGYGVQRPDSSWDPYNRDASRLSSIRKGIGGLPDRVIVGTPRKR